MVLAPVLLLWSIAASAPGDAATIVSARVSWPIGDREAVIDRAVTPVREIPSEQRDQFRGKLSGAQYGLRVAATTPRVGLSMMWGQDRWSRACPRPPGLVLRC